METLCSALLLSSIACNSGSTSTSVPGVPSNQASNEEESEQSPSDISSSVEFWLDKLGKTEHIVAVCHAQLTDSGIDVQIQNYPDTAAYQTSIQQSIDSSSAPGLFTWWSGGQLETLARNGKIADLSDEWDSYIENGVSPDIRVLLQYQAV